METSDNISYIYDVNGNMVADKNKGITLIEYNDFNLPTKIHFSTEDQSGKYIEYVYDASGVKLRKLVKDENQSNYHISLYAGAYIYEQTTSASSPSLKFILQPEGYFEPTGTSPSGELEGAYTYQYKDHTSTMLSAGLGNIRLSYSDIDGNGVIDPATEIKEAKDYYAFGLEHNVPNKQIIGTKHPYGYNGKEENGELGLEWLDFGARNYDASLGRWMNVDPLAEQAPDWTPYRYGFNNPIKYIDPDGMFETEGDAKQWAKDNNIRTGWFSRHKVEEGNDGIWSVNNKKEGLSYFKDSSLDDLEVVGRRDDGVIESTLVLDQPYNELNEITTEVSDIASDTWNSSTARNIVPDKISLSLSASTTAYLGFNKDISLNWITRGHDAQFTPYTVMTIGVQGGAKASADALINISTGKYATTDMRSLQKGQARDALLGWGIYGNFSLGAGYGGTATGSVGFERGPFMGAPTWITTGLGGGVSIGGGGSIGVSYSFPINPNQFK